MDDAWVKLLGSVDLVAILAIAIVAYVLESTRKVPDEIAVLVPLMLGAGWGAMQGVDQGWGFNAAVVKGVLVNGAAASVMARLAVNWLPTIWAAKPAPALPQQNPPPGGGA